VEHLEILVLFFNGSKVITTSGRSDYKFIGVEEESNILATQAREEAPHYQHISSLYRMSNICAGIEEVKWKFG
jgi:hypothetical protein